MTNERQLVPARGHKATGMPTRGLMILVGHPKSGKTKFAASFPDSYVLELEKNGADRIEGRIEDIVDTIDANGAVIMSAIDNMREALMAAVGSPEVKTIIIDTVDQLSTWLCDEIAGKRGLSKITERKPGVDGFEMWGELGAKMEGLIQLFKETDKLFIITAHCKPPEYDDSKNVIIPAGINVPGKSGAKLAAEADIIGYCYKKLVGGRSEYCCTFQGGPLGTWGSRIEEINDRTITLPKGNPYSAFAALFGKSEPAARPVMSVKPAASTKSKPAPAAARRK